MVFFMTLWIGNSAVLKEFLRVPVQGNKKNFENK